MKTFHFDLQLFAEDGADVPQDGNPTPETPNDPQQQSENESNAGTSILGGSGENTNTENQQQPTETVYDFSALVPDGMQYDEKAAGEFGNIARECGLSQEQAGKIAAYGMEYMKNGVNAARQEVAATEAKWGEDAKAKLGADFEKTVARAGVGIDKLSQKIPGLREMFNETGAGNRIEMIQLMAAIGDLVGEDRGHDASNFGGEKTLYPKTNFDQYH